MRILFIADLRSPTARNWIDYFVTRGDDVHGIASFPVTDPSAFSFPVHRIPLAFSGLGSARGGESPGRAATTNKLEPFIQSRLKSARGLRVVAGIRALAGPVEIRRHAAAAHRMIESIQPDLVHAMRIPYEGMFAARATPAGIPLLLSVWGNDFTLHAPLNPLIARETRHALSRANALHTDCQRDQRLAERWGFNAQNPSIVLPGSGGIRSAIFHPGPASEETQRRWAIPAGARVIVNPRGIREYVRGIELIHAFADVVRDVPEALLICVGAVGHRESEHAIRELGLEDKVRLVPLMAQNEIADLFRATDIVVSPSVHDGTPNSLLEGMACGCFPVAGDIDSIREWISDGVNGLLCDATKPDSITASLKSALNRPDLRAAARDANLRLLERRATYSVVMHEARDFYQEIAQGIALPRSVSTDPAVGRLPST